MGKKWYKKSKFQFTYKDTFFIWLPQYVLWISIFNQLVFPIEFDGESLSLNGRELLFWYIESGLRESTWFTVWCNWPGQYLLLHHFRELGSPSKRTTTAFCNPSREPAQLSPTHQENHHSFLQPIKRTTTAFSNPSREPAQLSATHQENHHSFL